MVPCERPFGDGGDFPRLKVAEQRPGLLAGIGDPKPRAVSAERDVVDLRPLPLAQNKALAASAAHPHAQADHLVIGILDTTFGGGFERL